MPDDDESSQFKKSLVLFVHSRHLGCIDRSWHYWCLILYMTIRPFSQTLYRRLAATLGCASFLDAMTLLLPNMRLYLTGDSDVPAAVGTSLFVCNHVMDGDWWSILMLGRCVGLRGSIKVFLRNEYLQVHAQKRTNSAPGSSAALVSRSEGSPSQLNKTVTFTRQAV